MPLEVRRRGSAQRPPRRLLSRTLSRLVFGPPPAATSSIDEDRLFAALRGQGGALAPAHVMRATGLDRASAEALLCRALARHGGRIEVIDGAVVYRLRPVRSVTRPSLPPVWERSLAAPGLTGRRRRADLALALLNLALVVASSAALGRLLGASGWWGMALAPLGISLLGLLLPLLRLVGQRGA